MANKQNRGYGEEMGKMENWRKLEKKVKKCNVIVAVTGIHTLFSSFTLENRVSGLLFFLGNLVIGVIFGWFV